MHLSYLFLPRLLYITSLFVPTSSLSGAETPETECSSDESQFSQEPWRIQVDWNRVYSGDLVEDPKLGGRVWALYESPLDQMQSGDPNKYGDIFEGEVLAHDSESDIKEAYLTVGGQPLSEGVLKSFKDDDEDAPKDLVLIGAQVAHDIYNNVRKKIPSLTCDDPWPYVIESHVWFQSRDGYVHSMLERLDDNLEDDMEKKLDGEFEYQRDFYQSKSWTASMFWQVITALTATHSEGLAHRDFTILNFLIRHQQSSQGVELPPVLKLADFDDAAYEAIGDVSEGAEFYRSPEDYFGIPGSFQKNDIWRLGVVYVELSYSLTMEDIDCFWESLMGEEDGLSQDETRDVLMNSLGMEKRLAEVFKQVLCKEEERASILQIYRAYGALYPEFEMRF